MKMKLTQQEFKALYIIIDGAVNCDTDTMNMLQKMLHAIMDKVFRKLYVKALDIKTSYTVKLDDAEAIAFWMLYNKHSYELTSFEGNMLNKITSRIHQHYS